MQLDCGLCLVRDWRPGDKASLVRAANNRNVWRNLTHRFPHPYTEADADFWFALLGKMARPSHWAIEVEGEACWGRGIMTAAVRATSDHLFAHFGVARLQAPVFEWNPASMRVLEKCGFVREGVLRRSILKDGQLIDAVLYARVR